MFVCSSSFKFGFLSDIFLFSLHCWYFCYARLGCSRNNYRMFVHFIHSFFYNLASRFICAFGNLTVYRQDSLVFFSSQKQKFKTNGNSCFLQRMPFSICFAWLHGLNTLAISSSSHMS